MKKKIKLENGTIISYEEFVKMCDDKMRKAIAEEEAERKEIESKWKKPNDKSRAKLLKILRSFDKDPKFFPFRGKDGKLMVLYRPLGKEYEVADEQMFLTFIEYFHGYEESKEEEK